MKEGRKNLSSPLPSNTKSKRNPSDERYVDSPVDECLHILRQITGNVRVKAVHCVHYWFFGGSTATSQQLYCFGQMDLDEVAGPQEDDQPVRALQTGAIHVTPPMSISGSV